MIRVYSILSLGAAVLVTAAEVLLVVIHFMFKVRLLSLVSILSCMPTSGGNMVDRSH